MRTLHDNAILSHDKQAGAAYSIHALLQPMFLGSSTAALVA
jgi:hypothetical protein